MRKTRKARGTRWELYSCYDGVSGTSKADILDTREDATKLRHALIVAGYTVGQPIRVGAA